MKRGWTEVALGEVLKRRREVVSIEDDECYKRVSIRLNNRGVALRDKQLGEWIGTKTQFRIKQGDFIISKIDARNGAFGVVPPSCDGAIITGNFWTFDINPYIATSRYLYWLSKSSFFKSFSIYASEGTTNRRYLQEIKFNEQKISLPSLSEQQRIVAHLDAIEQRLKRIQKLREESEKENNALITGLTHRWDLSNEQKLNKGWIPTNLGEVMQKTSDSVSVDPTSNYCNFGILSYAKGTFKKPAINGSTSSAPALYRVRKGQFIYSRLFAFEGAYALVTEELDGFFVSNEFPSFDIDQKRLLPEFIFSYFKSRSIWEALASQAVGLGNRRQRIHPEIILKHKIFLPPIEYQEMVRDTLYKLDKAQCNSIEPEHSALLPSLLDSIFNS